MSSYVYDPTAREDLAWSMLRNGDDTVAIAKYFGVKESRVVEWIEAARDRRRAMCQATLSGSARVKGGKIKIKPVYRDASAAIRAKKSKKQKVVRRSP